MGLYVLENWCYPNWRCDHEDIGEEARERDWYDQAWWDFKTNANGLSGLKIQKIFN